MTNYEIQQCWEKAERLAENIANAYYTGIGIKQARKDQENLKLWLQMVKEYGLVYNGSLDEYIALKL